MSKLFINIAAPNNNVAAVEGSHKDRFCTFFITKPSLDSCYPDENQVCRLGGFFNTRTVEYKPQNKKGGLISLSTHSEPVRATLCHLRPVTSCRNEKRNVVDRCFWYLGLVILGFIHNYFSFIFNRYMRDRKGLLCLK